MKTRLLTQFTVLLTLLLLAACGQSAVLPTPTSTPEAPPTPDPAAIVQALNEATNSGDVDAAVALFADDAVFQIDFFEQTHIGVDQIREFIEMLVAENFRIEVTPKEIDGGTVTTETKTWGGGMPGEGPNVATEVYVIEDGKITSVTWTPNEETVAKLIAAIVEMEAEAIVQALNEARNSGDADAVVAFFADDAVYSVLPPSPDSPDPIVGKEGIRARWARIATLNSETIIEITGVDENTVTALSKFIDDDLRGFGLEFIEGVEEYVIQDGKVTSYTWTTTEESLAELMAVMPPPEEMPE